MRGEPIGVLVAALGGEGGGVLIDWIVHAAEARGFPVQRTAVPGVAQRTGATTYYLELHPLASGPAPVFGLEPGTLGVDVLVSTELVEAVRATVEGHVDPVRTRVLTSTHRVWTIDERSNARDARFDGYLAADTLAANSAALETLDLPALAKRCAARPNALLLGALARTGWLPLRPRHFEAGIRRVGVDVEENLAGFRNGLEGGGEAGSARPTSTRERGRLPVTLSRGLAALDPGAGRSVAEEGVRRLLDYQDEGYARLYLDRLQHVSGLPSRVAEEAARRLALWMSYEDAIRVAQLKTRRGRYRRLVEQDLPVGSVAHVTEFLSPGLDELCAVLPARLGKALLAWAERRGFARRAHWPLEVRTSTVSGFLVLWLLARWKGLRPYTHRFRTEQSAIEDWLDDLSAAASCDEELAVEVARAAGHLQGYAATHERGRATFERLRREALLEVLAGRISAADAVHRYRVAWSSSPEKGDLVQIGVGGRGAHGVGCEESR